MKSEHFKYLIKLIMLISPFLASGQWGNRHVAVNFSMPQISLIDIEPDSDNSINYTILPGHNPGSAPVIINTQSTQLWLNYTSSLPSFQGTRMITAEIADGSAPSGFKIFLEASAYYGNGKGKMGAPAGKVELTQHPRPVISGIGNTFTGDGINHGHRLNFTLEVSNYADIKKSENNSFTILYTLTDN